MEREIKMAEFQLIYKDDRIQATRESNDLYLTYLKAHSIKIDINDKVAIDDEIIRMLKLRTKDNKKYFVQQTIGKIMNLSRQMINRRWQVYKSKGLPALLNNDIENSRITPQLLKRITQLSVANPFLSGKELRKTLCDEGLCDDISISTIYNAQHQMDGKEMIELLREKGDRSDPEVFMSSQYIFEKLFEIIESLIEKIPVKSGKSVLPELNLYEHLKSHIQKTIKKHTNRDVFEKRKKLERDKRRNIGFIKRLLTGFNLNGACPDCHSKLTKLHLKRDRFYKDEKGEKIWDYSSVYKCCNPECKTKYFTIPPKGVELYARVHKNVKKAVFRWVFHLRGTLSRVVDELLEYGIEVSLTTVLRWIKKAGEECVEPLKILDSEYWQQTLIIDEKWVKIRKEWNYVFTGVGSIASDLLAVDLFAQKDAEAMETFLLWIKSQGFRPKIIVTDLLMGYGSVIKEVFPDCYHHQCVLHAERDAKRLVRKYWPDGRDDKFKEKLIKSIRKLFASKRTKQLKKRFVRLLMLREESPPEINNVFTMLSNYYPKLCKCIVRKDIPKTTNAVERAIGEFEEKYCLTKGFTSFYYARCFIKVFQIYYRFRKLSFGVLKGKSRLGLKGNPLAKLKFTDYLIPTQH
jgi:transposase-like protein